MVVKDRKIKRNEENLTHKTRYSFTSHHWTFAKVLEKFIFERNFSEETSGHIAGMYVSKKNYRPNFMKTNHKSKRKIFGIQVRCLINEKHINNISCSSNG